MDTEELFSLYPDISPCVKASITDAEIASMKTRLLSRFPDYTEEEIKQQLSFSAIMVLALPRYLEMHL